MVLDLVVGRDSSSAISATVVVNPGTASDLDADYLAMLAETGRPSRGLRKIVQIRGRIYWFSTDEKVPRGQIVFTTAQRLDLLMLPGFTISVSLFAGRVDTLFRVVFEAHDSNAGDITAQTLKRLAGGFVVVGQEVRLTRDASPFFLVKFCDPKGGGLVDAEKTVVELM